MGATRLPLSYLGGFDAISAGAPDRLAEALRPDEKHGLNLNNNLPSTTQ